MTAMTVERLEAFGEALDRRDLGTVASYLTEDCRYEASAAPTAEGLVFSGRDEVVRGLASFLDRYPDGHYVDTSFVVAGDRGFGEWTFSGRDRHGQAINIRGYDLYEFSADKIRLKNAFRKVVQA